MRHILLARGVLALGLPAFALSMSATPAFAAQRDDHNHKSDTVKVKVCKKVVSDRYDNKDKARDDDKNRRPKFAITVETDREDKTFYLKDGECDWTKLDYKRPRLTVSEEDEHGYKLKDIKAWGDVDDVYFNSRRGEAKIRFDDSGRYDPEVNVLVINKKDRRDDNHNH
ncbi:MAG: hypothetical protein QOF52_741 [Propionibacteriaceae bacterium]|jgi:hypothetical protein|nr:hypothetical protein [Propionibacteriaceae bacterium]MDX6320883.1 hypothetical protein [Propionibacteriaceae bacterium]